MVVSLPLVHSPVRSRQPYCCKSRIPVHILACHFTPSPNGRVKRLSAMSIGLSAVYHNATMPNSEYGGSFRFCCSWDWALRQPIVDPSAVSLDQVWTPRRCTGQALLACALKGTNHCLGLLSRLAWGLHRQLLRHGDETECVSSTRLPYVRRSRDRDDGGKGKKATGQK